VTTRTDALIDKLSEIHPKGFDLSLDRITTLLEKLGNPHLKIPPAIHVAGTNGKGSTLAFCRSILEAAGYSVHVHTSPHLVNWNERYRLAGSLVSDDVLANAIERVANANNNQPITIFEIMSAVMCVLFSEHKADFSLVEVGLGGRFDATNVIQNLIVTAITPVALDHQAYLGDTISKIAFEKAGIIKHKVPVAIGRQHDDARDTIEEVALKKQSSIFIAGQDFDAYRDATGFAYQDSDGLIDLPLPQLVGEHQIDNAALAMAALRVSGIKIDDQAWAKGMKTVTWPGRLQRLSDGTIAKNMGGNPDLWIDGGHNPAAGEVIAKELLRQRAGANRKLLLVCGMINTKEPSGYFEAFKELNADVITIPVAMSEASIPAKELAKYASAAGLSANTSQSLQEGIEQAKAYTMRNEDAQILFCGSLYMVGEVLAHNKTPPT
jgi:dihydrofolate synthase/folylpolyglutamate synthase